MVANNVEMFGPSVAQADVWISREYAMTLAEEAPRVAEKAAPGWMTYRARYQMGYALALSTAWGNLEAR